MDENPYKSPETQSEVAPMCGRPMAKSLIVRGAIWGVVVVLGLFLPLVLLDQWWHAMGYRTESSSGPIKLDAIVEGSFCSVMVGSLMGAIVSAVRLAIADRRRARMPPEDLRR